MPLFIPHWGILHNYRKVKVKMEKLYINYIISLYELKRNVIPVIKEETK